MWRGDFDSCGGAVPRGSAKCHLPLHTGVTDDRMIGAPLSCLKSRPSLPIIVDTCSVERLQLIDILRL